jgi:hypothetical protein
VWWFRGGVRARCYAHTRGLRIGARIGVLGLGLELTLALELRVSIRVRVRAKF